MAKVLVVDDDTSVRHLIAAALGELEVEVLPAATMQAGLEILAAQVPDVILLDIKLPDMSGLDAFTSIHQMAPKSPIIFVTASGTSDTAIAAMKMGAFDYLVKPLDVAQVRELVHQALEIRRLMHVKVGLQSVADDDAASDCLVGRAPQMQEVYKSIGRVASRDVTVLIHGESGTGKELVARAIFQHSDRADARFLAVNCAALTESLLESELFGHEKGAFTGANTQRIGKFEQCMGGTLFLDEIGDMSPLVQSKVLRVLQERHFERVGGAETIHTDARIIAATNRDLEKMVAEGEFREDLYYRINGYTIDLPPLRERKSDIPLLLEWFLARYRRELGKEVYSVSTDAIAALMNYNWPGNIRQFQNVLRRALLQANGSVLIAEFFPQEIKPEDADAESVPENSLTADLLPFITERLNADSRNLYAETLERMECCLLTAVLRETAGNQSKAASILGITRGSLRNKIRTLGISLERSVNLLDDDTEDRMVADLT